MPPACPAPIPELAPIPLDQPGNVDLTGAAEPVADEEARLELDVIPPPDG